MSSGRDLVLKDSLVLFSLERLDPVAIDALLSADNWYLVVFSKSNSAAVWLIKEVQGPFPVATA